MPRKITIDDSERQVILRLLGNYQDLLESSIGALVVPGTERASTEADQQQLEQDRRNWLIAEAMVLRLEGRGRARL